jgi:hypothetical protein
MSSSRTSRRSRAAACAVILSIIAPMTAHADDAAPSATASAAPVGTPAAPSSAPPSRKGFVVGGAVVFALTYIGSALAATTGYANSADLTSARGFLWVPAVGPFIQMGNATAAGDVFLVLDGLAQVGGLSMLVYGLAAPRAETAFTPPKPPAVSLVPMVTPQSTGALLVGRF